MSTSSPSASSSSSLTLPVLYKRLLKSLLPIFDDSLSVTAPEAQSLLTAAQSELELIERMLGSLGVFSVNETMEDVGEKEMVFMSVEWVRGEVEGRKETKGIKSRLAALQRSKSAYDSFLYLLESYSLPYPPGSPPPSSATTSTAPLNPASRREAKIAAYRLEKSLKDNVATALPGVDVASSVVTALIVVLEAGAKAEEGDNNVNIRQATIAILQLLRIQTQSSLSFIEQEMALLTEASKTAHIDEDADDEDNRRETGREQVDTTWRLDKPLRRPGEGARPAELIDERGKPLQPFTILPSAGLQGISDRARLQSEVFRSGHRLPTMTVDEYLEEEKRRGNIITGGGPAQDAQLTTSELLALAAEEDGTALGASKAEELRQKEEKWATYTDEHRKGEGNTMNRG